MKNNKKDFFVMLSNDYGDFYEFEVSEERMKEIRQMTPEDMWQYMYKTQIEEAWAPTRIELTCFYDEEWNLVYYYELSATFSHIVK